MKLKPIRELRLCESVNLEGNYVLMIFQSLKIFKFKIIALFILLIGFQPATIAAQPKIDWTVFITVEEMGQAWESVPGWGVKDSLEDKK
ncbi:MAG: hypothetical protein ACJATA_002143 [Sphingobacteriales bacterium]|jgi:hypothetical protein